MSINHKSRIRSTFDVVTQIGCRGVASIGLSGLEPPLCLPKVGSVGGPTVYGCTIAWPDKLKLLDKLYKIYN